MNEIYAWNCERNRRRRRLFNETKKTCAHSSAIATRMKRASELVNKETAKCWCVRARKELAIVLHQLNDVRNQIGFNV